MGIKSLRALCVALVSVIVSLSPYVVWAQTVVNPRTVEFDPSPEHFVDDGGVAHVQEYRLSLYLLGQSAPTVTVNLGKPAPDVDGKIRFDLASVMPFTLPAGVAYEARVVAVGPGGESESALSNDFLFQPACTPSISTSGQSVDANGGGGSVSVSADTSCTWTATSAASWLTVTSGAGGSGDGVVTFTAAANTSSSSRSGMLTVAGQIFTVQQAGAISCSAGVQPASLLAIAAGGLGVVTVTMPSGCPWTAASNASWLSVTAGAAGSGNGTVSLSATANTSSNPRTGTATIAGQTVTVTQSGQACTYSVAGATQSISAAGGLGTVGVTTQAGCTWTVSSSASWVSVTVGDSGTGTGAAFYTAAPNTGAARTATLIIAGQTVTLTQAAAACTYAIGATSQALPAAGGSGLVAVTAPGGCAWTAVSNATWLTVTAGASGTGSATVAFSATPNTSTLPRTGTLTIAGQTFTVTQSVSACSYTISATSKTVPAGGGSGSVAVATQSGCQWAGVSSVDWVQITTGVSWTGSGNVNFSATANGTGAARTATLTIAGLPFAVSQPAGAAACAFTLNPSSAMVDWKAATATVTVTTTPGCAWKATTATEWIKLGASTANKQTYNVGLNKGTANRTGTIQIGSSTFTVIQRGR